MEETVLNITGMSCTACAKRIEDTLNTQRGVLSAVVNFWKKNVEIAYDEAITDVPTLQRSIKELGYELTEESMVE